MGQMDFEFSMEGVELRGGGGKGVLEWLLPSLGTSPRAPRARPQGEKFPVCALGERKEKKVEERKEKEDRQTKSRPSGGVWLVICSSSFLLGGASVCEGGGGCVGEGEVPETVEEVRD